MHKQTRFLPPIKSETDQFTLKPESKSFEPYESADFLRILREKMAGSADGNSAPKAPSPFGRVWQYRRSLAGDLGEHRQKEAVSYFRGIMALLAMRDFYHLPVVINVSPQLKGCDTTLQQLFSPHLDCTPKSESAESLSFLWNERIVYFALRPLKGDDIPFAGYSPLSLVYPASKPLPATMANLIFWWNEKQTRFEDPTSLPAIHPSSMEARRIRPHIKAWLNHVIENIRDLKLSAADFQLIHQIFVAWARELNTEQPEGVDIEISQPTKGNRLLTDEKTLDVLPVPPIFTWKVKTDHVTDVTKKISRHTQRETLIIVLGHIKSPDVKVFNAIHGSSDLERKLRAAPAFGDDLGAVLGQAAPIPYVIIDHLLEQRLTKVYENVNNVVPRITNGWNLLAYEAEAFLYPFKKEILNYFSADEICASGSLVDGATSLTFEFKCGSLHLQRHYFANERPLLDNSMDLRLFPNFAIDSLGNFEKLLPKKEDRRYYARLRLYPGNDNGSNMRWLNESGSEIPQEPYTEGNFDKAGNSCQRFWLIENADDLKNRPRVFHVLNSGLLFVQLGLKNFNSEQPMPWQVGLDFGTSNTCIVRRKQNDTQPEILHLPVFTTTLFEKWEVDRARGNAAEGYSAIFDFPYHNKSFSDDAVRLGISEALLNPKNFFPTQIVHHENKVAPAANAPSFVLKNGLAIFQNITVTSLLAKNVSELLKGFDELKTKPDAQHKPAPVRFVLNRSLKWENDSDSGTFNNLAWRRVFHHHLRYQIVLAAAFENATVETLFASFPKAFTDVQEHDYSKLLNDVWQAEPGGDYNNVQIILRSESSAAASYFEVENAQVFYLIDIGGGTSDIAIYSNKGLTGECSIKLAGNCFEQYFSRSLKYREVIATKRKKHGEFNYLTASRLEDFDKCLKSETSTDGSSDSMFKTAFHGILNIIAPKVLIFDTITNEGESPAQVKACTGFMLTNVVLYSSLAYFVGLVQGRRERPGAAQFTLQWVGNGSCFLDALNLGRDPKSFHDVLSKLFEAGANCEIESKTLPHAKQIVAIGLLKNCEIQDTSSPNIASQLFSDSLSNNQQSANQAPETLASNQYTSEDTLAEFYAQPTLDHIEWNGLNNGCFKRYLESLQTALPKLIIGNSQQVLGSLSALNIRNTDNWAIEYVSNRKTNIAKLLNKRLRTNHDIWSKIAKDMPGKLQVEPIFISEIAALIDDIREFCGEGKN